MIAILRNIVGLLGGLVLGGLVNMGLIMLGPSIIPPPPGVDVTNAESIAASMHLFEAKHFVVPFVAHALGTLVGAMAAFFIAGSYRPQIAYLVGAVFFAGGIWASTMIPAPTWFITVDLVFAYFPMAWIGAKLAGLTLSGLGVQSGSPVGDA
jgi:hypothetical protein